MFLYQLQYLQVVFVWIWETFFSNTMTFRTRTHFWSSVNICNIHMAEIFRTFKIRFKMKCTRDSDKPTSLVISGIVYLLSLSITFIICNCETFALPVTANARKILFFDGLCGSQFLSLFTNSLTIPIRHINFLQFSTNPHYRMTDFCANWSNCQFF